MKKREGELSKQNIEPHKDITRDSDQLLHEPAAANRASLSDQQEGLGERTCLLVRLPNALKLEITCDPSFLPILRTAFRRVKAEIVDEHPESLSRELAEAMDIEESRSKLSFKVPGMKGSVVVFTSRVQEEQVEELFAPEGWEAYDIERDV